MTRKVSIEALADAIRPGERIYMPGSAAEPIALWRALADRPERTRDVEIVTSAVPGINPLTLDGLHESARMTGLFMQPGLREAQREGRFRHLPLSYSGFVRHLRERAALDTCIVQVAPPDADGNCSLGPAVEFTQLAASRSARVLALVNPNVPRMPGAVSLPYGDFDLVCEVDTALPIYAVGAPSRQATAIAALIAGFVQDGSTLQAGLGKVPESLFGLLHDRRGLRLRSGMLGDGALTLAATGALAPDALHESCVWVGSAALYRALDGLAGFAVSGCETTHDIARLAAIPGFIAVNSALSVDLFGQANLECAGGRAVSGVGGAPDFAQGARLSAGGISIVALPASFGTPATSRIVPRLAEGIVSLTRQLVDVVVTEWGAADLRGLDVSERAAALIGVAAPAFREGLARAWHETAQQL